MKRPQTLLSILLTDSTYAHRAWGGSVVWRGRCIHCETQLCLHLDGTPISDVAAEHLRPRHHGGTDEPRNLALTCCRCRQRKGYRVDSLRHGDPRAEAIITRCVERRSRRWREPAGAR